jgi:hypothetical protein
LPLIKRCTATTDRAAKDWQQRRGSPVLRGERQVETLPRLLVPNTRESFAWSA